MQLTVFSRESRLPCKVDKIISTIKRRKLTFNHNDKLALTKDILAVPFNSGFVLCCKEVILFVDSIELLNKLDGNNTFGTLIAEKDAERALEQLFYYNLVSSGFPKGILRQVEINQKYVRRYHDGDFVMFSMIPLAVELNITNRCNFRCMHCSKDSLPRDFENELTTEEILSIIYECSKIGVPELRFMGGEPLIHPGFFEFVKCAKENGIFQLKLSTNASLIDAKKSEELAKYFDSIQISVHGASPAVHDAIVGKKGAWEQAKRAAKILNENGVRVNIGFSVMHENVDDVSKMPELVMDWRASSLGFLCLIPQGRGVQLRNWEEGQILDLGEVIRGLKERLDPCLNLDVAGFPPLYSIKKDATVYGCEAGKTLLAVDPDGSVKLCGILKKESGLKVIETPILEIWHSPYFVESRKRPSCLDCNYGQICWGPCRFLDK